MISRLSTARQALKLGVVLGAFCTLAAFGQLADANVSEAAALRARMAPLAVRIGGDFSDVALARALGVDLAGFRASGPTTGAELAPNALLSDPLAAQAGGAVVGPAPEVVRQANAATPFDPAGPVSARPFVVTGAKGDQTRAETCLTQAVYFEAGSESADGGRAVAQVVLNRMRNAMFPHSVCGVVYQGASLATGCQFSFTCDGSLARPVADWAWERARTIARDALHGHVFTPVGLATHYHADYVAPYWRTTVSKVAQIGAHIFYRWPGALGGPDAFTARYAGAERILTVRVAPQPARAGAPASDEMVMAANAPDGRVHARFAVASAGPSQAPAATRVTPLVVPAPAPLVVAAPAPPAPASSEARPAA